MALRGDIGLDVAINEKLANKPFDAGGRQVLINSLKLYGSGDNAVLALRLQKPIDAEIFLLAKPVLDIEKNELHLENVDFALATSSLWQNQPIGCYTVRLQTRLQKKHVLVLIKI